VSDGPGDLLTLQEAAEQLKVHYMTAYRWVRQGDLPAFKAGGRLRVRRTDVDRFVTQRRVDVVNPQPGRTDWPTHVTRLYELLVEGRGGDAAQLVRKVIADGAPVGQVYLDLLTPALHRIGDAWAAGSITVAAEHRAAEICSVIIARLGDHFRRRGPARGVAVTLTPPGELHGIAATMAADFLRAGGFDVHHLGVNVPVAELRQFLSEVPCDVLCVSVTMTPEDPAVYTSIANAAGADAPMVVTFGGQGVDPELAAAAGGVVIDSLDELPSKLDELVHATV
jgi:MerR family transcriptional regulator, light-induced transcriptional regulator